MRAVLVLLACMVGAAQAGPITFDLIWSGAPANGASAVGQITFEETLLPNPGYWGSDTMPPWVLDLWVTVSGTSTGNGTFTLGSFDYIAWDTGGGTLDLNQQLIGQTTMGSPWGTPDMNGGDFNLFSITGLAPNGTWYFTLTPGGSIKGGGEDMLLTSMVRASGVPEPGAFGLAGLGLAALYVFLRRKRT